MKNTSQQGITLLFFTVIGGAVALALFLGTFILSSRAKVPDPRNNLRIPVPSVPDLPTPSLHPRQIIPSPQAPSSASAVEAPVPQENFSSEIPQL